MKILIDDLNQRLIDELGLKLAVFVTPEKAKYLLELTTIFSSDIRDCYRSAKHDMDEACQCFAFERYTGCVFHLMRLMERAVQRLGKRLHIKDLHKKPWGQILNEVKPKINEMPHSTPQQERKQNKFNHNYQLLDAVCRATRNPTMHPKITDIKQSYTEDEAKDLMDRIKSFMEDFAKLR